MIGPLPLFADAQSASLIRRAVALLVDLFLINLLGAMLMVAAYYGMALGLRQAGLSLPSRDLVCSIVESFAVGWPALVIAYFGFFTAQDGQTPGKMAVRIMVISTRQTAVGPLQAWWRACLIGASLPLFPILVLAAFTPQHRALHDYLAGTRVIVEPSPLPRVVDRMADPVQSAAPSSIPT
jgi:uncharacterized RDD family membrane protein YckC